MSTPILYVLTSDYVHEFACPGNQNDRGGRGSHPIRMYAQVVVHDNGGKLIAVVVLHRDIHIRNSGGKGPTLPIGSHHGRSHYFHPAIVDGFGTEVARKPNVLRKSAFGIRRGPVIFTALIRLDSPTVATVLHIPTIVGAVAVAVGKDFHEIASPSRRSPGHDSEQKK